MSYSDKAKRQNESAQYAISERHTTFGGWDCMGWSLALQARKQMGSIPISSIKAVLAY